MTELRRDLGFPEMTAVAASMMLGSGIFFGPSATAKEFPSTTAVMLFWGFGGLVALCGAWAFGRLASFYPFSGGPYVYVREAYGDFPAFLFAWTSFSIIAPTSMAVMAHVFGAHLSEVSVLSGTGIALVALWGIGAATFANLIGVKTGGRTQDFLTGVKILLVAGLILLLFRAPHVSDAPAAAAGEGHFAAAFVGVLFSVGGWEYAVLASEEVRDPRRTIPRALFAGTAIVVVLYLLIVFAFLWVLGPAGVGAASALAPEAAEQAWPGSSRVVGILVAISALGTLNAVTLLGPRATFALARDGLAPAAVARLSKRWATPVVALLLNLVLTSTYLLSGTWETVASYTVMGTGAFIVLSAVALPRLRKRAGAPTGPLTRFEDAAAYFVALTFFAFILFELAEKPAPTLIGLGIIAGGAIPYVAFRKLGYLHPTSRTPPPQG